MLDRLYEFPDITIEEIAYLANTTPSSVTKFCKRIGYNGFTNIKSDAFFQNNNLEYISNHHTTPKEYYDTI
ncbi:MAG: MurR/RpiR family transcriptional regulator, partial [Coprobacillus cateniformis]|nr:MurR/RpiR family transcriptional regulator [Coprobacillus cateniformis]